MLQKSKISNTQSVSSLCLGMNMFAAAFGQAHVIALLDGFGPCGRNCIDTAGMYRGAAGRAPSHFESTGAFAHRSGAASACTLLATWTQTCPGDEMAGGGESRHIDADLRRHPLRCEITHRGRPRQEGQAESQQIGDPSRILHIRVAARRVLDLLRVSLCPSSPTQRGYSTCIPVFPGLDGAGSNSRDRSNRALRGVNARGNNSRCSIRVHY
jgi:hypothetical protein